MILGSPIRRSTIVAVGRLGTFGRKWRSEPRPRDARKRIDRIPIAAELFSQEDFPTGATQLASAGALGGRGIHSVVAAGEVTGSPEMRYFAT